MSEYRYRVLQRNADTGGEWHHWMGNIYPSRPSAERWVRYMEDMSGFFDWGTEFKIQRQPYGEWEEIPDE